MIEGSWLPVTFLQRQSEKEFEDKIGFIPALPVPYKNNQTSTLMGGYALGIPKASTHKDLAWKLIELTLEPKILGPYLRQTGVLPTQISMGKSDLLNSTALSYPYYRQLVSMIPFAGTRPSIPEYPQIADNIRQAIYEVQFENKDPNQASRGADCKICEGVGLVAPTCRLHLRHGRAQAHVPHYQLNMLYKKTVFILKTMPLICTTRIYCTRT